MTESTRNQDSTKARTRTAPEAPRGSVTALAASRLGSSPPGAPPSNTAPANCIDGSNRIFRTGIDSLYLTFKGDTYPEVQEQLEALKALAQSEDRNDQAKAVFHVLNHRFEVLDKGRGRFPFVLSDGWFDIQVSRSTSKVLPMCSVQISSELLTQSDIRMVLDALNAVITHLGTRDGITVSRVDLCCDFETSVELEWIPKRDWVRRARKRRTFDEGDDFTGYAFGLGGALAARIYDKTFELRYSKKEYMKDLWFMNGWDRESQVWRLEFQYRRSVLGELSINTTWELLERLNGLWAYACNDWLRLTIPSADKTKSRWPNHPLWDLLKTASFGNDDHIPPERVRKNRSPTEQFLFVNGLAPITSFMAIENIDNVHEAIGLFLERAENYHLDRSVMTGKGLVEYAQEMKRKKARKYNLKSGLDEKEKPEVYLKAKGRK